jgi:HPt (histidine-containing phosphotransfer) domain-containing protein
MTFTTRHLHGAKASIVSEEKQHYGKPVWDERAFDELRAIGGADLVKRVVRQSIQDAEDRITELRQHRLEAPPNSWREAAHALHGVALSVGAIRLSELIARALDHERIEQAQSYAAEFAQHFSEVRNVLSVFLA